jgi:hypothetical protein
MPTISPRARRYLAAVALTLAAVAAGLGGSAALADAASTHPQTASLAAPAYNCSGTCKHG